MKLKNLPNMITALRIIGTLCLIACENYTMEFYVVFTLCGLSDVMDGFLARVTHSVSTLGAKLDSIADLLFYSVMGVKLLPDMIRILPLWLWMAAAAVILTRVLCYIITGIRFKCFASMHTYMNKLTGFTVFVMPYTIISGYFVVHCIVLSIISAISTLEELVMTLMMKDTYEPKRSIFLMSKKKIAA
ncbi:MAG: CDP-alcohol phosphatidyltransferase family protein [Lachnospiraceae bacterium]|nr:CDP-alcohol phosphatidyltransferase family protein [Lachnospiraceae bacterium]